MEKTTIPSVRAGSDITIGVRLKYSGVPIDWSGMSDVRALIYSDARKALSGRCLASIRTEDPTVLSCEYPARKPQYVGVNRIIIQAKYQGRTCSFDKPAFNVVPRTALLSAPEVVVIDPSAEEAVEVDVTIEITEVTTGLLDRAIAAALKAADEAEEAAHLVPLQVLEDCREATGAAAAAKDAANAAAVHAIPYIGENGHWWKWDSEAGAYVDTGEVAKGDTGNGIQSVEQTVESQESGGENVVTVTMTDGTTAQFTIRNGRQGVQGIQGIPGVANARYKQVAELPEAGAGTMDFIYLTPSQTEGVYNMSYTEEGGGSYTWRSLGTTAIQLADYATKDEFSQLSSKVGELSFEEVPCTAISWLQDAPSKTDGILISSENFVHTRIELNGAKRVRFLGNSYSNPAAWTYGFAFYDANDACINAYEFARSTTGNRTQEYTVKVPSGAYYFRTIAYIGSTYPGLVTEDDFYCYLQYGNTVSDDISSVEKVAFSKLSSIRLNGAGVDFTYIVSRDFLPGHTYKVYVKSWVGSSSGTNSKLKITAYLQDSTFQVLVNPQSYEAIQPEYTIVCPDNLDYMSIGGRLDVGETGILLVEDITGMLLSYGKTDRHILATVRMQGAGNTLVYSDVFEGIIPGHKYKVYVKSWDVTGVTSGATNNKFAVTSYNSLDEPTSLVKVLMGDTLADSYEFYVPEDSAYVKFNGRVTSGQEGVAYFTDITDVGDFATHEEVANKVDKSVLASSQQNFSYGIQLVESGTLTFFTTAVYLKNATTDFIPVSNGDVIQWYNGWSSGLQNFHLVLYDENKEYLTYYSASSGTVDGLRTITLNNENVAYIRASVYHAGSITPKVVINGSVVWEYADPTLGLTQKAESSLVKQYEVKFPVIPEDWNPGYFRPTGDAAVVQLTETSSTSQKRSPYFKIEGFSRIRVTMNWFAASGTGCLLFYDSNGTYLANSSVNANLGQTGDSGIHNYQERLLTVPEGAVYLRTSFYGDILPSRFYLYGIVDSVNTSILYFNPDKEFLPKMQMAKKSVTEAGATPFVCMFFTDMHMKDNRNLQRIVEFYNHHNSYIDVVINGGDTVRDKYDDGFDWYAQTQGAEKILNVIGNHDVANPGGQTYTGADLYNRYVAPFSSFWGATFPDTPNACYYYRDYGSVRIIVLNVMNYDSTQNTWLTATLADAATNGKTVVVAAHCTGLSVVGFRCRWTSVRLPDSSCGAEMNLPNIANAAAAIDAFQQGGGIFACWLVGHVHRNIVGRLEAYNDQLVIISNASGIHTLDSDTRHVVGTRSQDDFNIISIDPDNRLIRAMKVGDDRDTYMRKIDTVVLSYESHTVITD